MMSRPLTHIKAQVLLEGIFKDLTITFGTPFASLLFIKQLQTQMRGGYSWVQPKIK